MFCSVLCANRYNRNNKKEVLLPTKRSSELAELFGVLLGDGSVTPYYTKVYLNRIADAGYDTYILSLMKQLFLKNNICIMDRPARGTKELQISSKEVSDYFIQLGFNPKERTVPNWIKENNDFTKAAIRGLFDTEGSIGIKKYKGKNGTAHYHQLTFTNKNKPLVEFVRSSLESMGYAPTKSELPNVYISNRVHIQRYFREIGTKNPKLDKKLKIIIMEKFN